MAELEGAHALVRRTHEERILRVLREFGALTRGEISARVGLSRTTTSEITAELILRRAIVTVAPDTAEHVGRGRPAERLVLDPGAGQYLGIDFGHRRVTIAVSDASHDVLATGTVPYSEDLPWPERITLAFDLVEKMSAESGSHMAALQGVGVGVPGPYAAFAESADRMRAHWRVLRPPADIGETFGRRFNATVIVDNNTRFAALAEALNGDGDVVDDVIFLRLSDGIGGGLVVGGRLLTGSAGFAGELGHVTVDPLGSDCRCGKRGCLETVASVPAILSSCRAAGLAINSLDDLEAAVAVYDPVADGVLREVGVALGRVLGSAAMALNPAQIVLAGPVVQIAPVLVEQAASTLNYELYSIPTSGPIIRAARGGDDAGALGAIAALFHNSPLLAAYAAKKTPSNTVQMQRSAL